MLSFFILVHILLFSSISLSLHIFLQKNTKFSSNCFNISNISHMKCNKRLATNHLQDKKNVSAFLSSSHCTFKILTLSELLPFYHTNVHTVNIYIYSFSAYLLPFLRYRINGKPTKEKGYALKSHTLKRWNRTLPFSWVIFCKGVLVLPISHIPHTCTQTHTYTGTHDGGSKRYCTKEITGKGGQRFMQTFVPPQAESE